MKHLASLLLIFLTIWSCSETKKSDLAFKTYNEGVAYSIEAMKEYNNANYEKSNELNEKAIDKFKETLRIDSLNKLAPSSLGHSYYLIGNFNEGILWFERAIKIDSLFAENHREYGLCKINLGNIQEAKKAFQKAFKLDTGDEIKNITVADLTDIGIRAFEYGIEYEKQGEKLKGLDYKKFSIVVLGTAYMIDSTKTETIKRIADYTEILGDLKTSKRFRDKLK